MFNRRQFIGTCVGTGIASYALTGLASTNKVEDRMLEIPDFYDQIRLNHYYNNKRQIELPLDLRIPKDDYILSHILSKNGPERHLYGDYVGVPLFQHDEHLADDAWHVLLASVADRNIIVYDQDNTDGQCTKRLLSLMKVTMRRNSYREMGTITDIYIPANKTFNAETQYIKYYDNGIFKNICVHAEPELNLDGKLYHYMRNNLGTGIVDGKPNYIIAVNRKDINAVVMTTDNGLAGVAIMNNDSLLLGCF